MNPELYFETERLLLRPTDTSDASFIKQLMTTPKWIEFIGDRGIKTDKDAINYIEEKMLPQLRRLGYGNFTLVRKKDKIKVGVCGLYDRPGMEGIDLGFALLSEFESMGYAFEASSLIMEKAFTDFKLSYVKAITSKENKASQKLLEKLGFESKGVITLPDDDEELLLFQKSQNH